MNLPDPAQVPDCIVVPTVTPPRYSWDGGHVTARLSHWRTDPRPFPANVSGGPYEDIQLTSDTDPRPWIRLLADPMVPLDRRAAHDIADALDRIGRAMDRLEVRFGPPPTFGAAMLRFGEALHIRRYVRPAEPIGPHGMLTDVEWIDVEPAAAARIVDRAIETWTEAHKTSAA
jgi:hypothetical protein